MLINEVLPPNKAGKQNYVRFIEKTTGKVIVANYRLRGMAKHVQVDDRSNYEFAVDRKVYKSKAKAEQARNEELLRLKAEGFGERSQIYQDMNSSRPKLTQDG